METSQEITENNNHYDVISRGSSKDEADTCSLGSWKDGSNECSGPIIADASTSSLPAVKSPSTRLSWADMAQEDELEGEEGEEEDEDRLKNKFTDGHAKPGQVVRGVNDQRKPELSREQREYIRFTNVQRKKDYICLERFNGKIVNILEGLELHSGVFSAVEQKKITDFVFHLQEMGRKGELKSMSVQPINLSEVLKSAVSYLLFQYVFIIYLFICYGCQCLIIGNRLGGDLGFALLLHTYMSISVKILGNQTACWTCIRTCMYTHSIKDCSFP